MTSRYSVHYLCYIYAFITSYTLILSSSDTSRDG